jgi:hypothetical protein
MEEFMYLHLGQDVMVLSADVVGIFDIENATIRRATRDFLRAAQRAGRVVEVSGELPKSFVICAEKGKKSRERVYLSQISSITLRKRAESLQAACEELLRREP